MKTSFMVTIDCDMRVSSAHTRSESLHALLDVFERHDAAGHVTWFVNENDFAISYLHPDFLEEAAGRGDTVAVHDHIDFLDGDWRYEPIRRFCEKSRNRLRSWLTDRGLPAELRAHRFGCMFQHPEAYRVVVDLGYELCSEVTPGIQHENHTGRPSFDNRDVPQGVLPYRHRPETVTDHKSRSGPLLQFPLLNAHLTAQFSPQLKREIVRQWLDGARELGQDRAAITFCFHPYEIVDNGSLSVDPESVDRLEGLLETMRTDFHADLLSLEEYADSRRETE